MVVFPDHTYYPVSAVWVFQLALPFLFSDFMLFTCEYITDRSGKKSFFFGLYLQYYIQLFLSTGPFWGKCETVSDFAWEE